MPDGLVLEMPYWSFGGLNTFVFDADMLKVVEIVLNDENRYCEYLGKEKCLKHTQKFNSDSSEWFVVPKMPDRRSEVKSNCIFHFGKLYPASGRITEIRVTEIMHCSHLETSIKIDACWELKSEFYSRDYGLKVVWFGAVLPTGLGKTHKMARDLENGVSRYGNRVYSIRFVDALSVYAQKHGKKVSDLNFFCLGTREYTSERSHTILISR